MAEPLPQKQVWHIWSPENASGHSGGKDLDHSRVVQNAYGGPCIMRSFTPVTDMKFALQKMDTLNFYTYLNQLDTHSLAIYTRRPFNMFVLPYQVVYNLSKNSLLL